MSDIDTYNNGVAIAVEGVSKSFKLPHEQHNGIKQLLVSTVKGKRKPGYETQKVLKDISFEIKQGEFFGIVGRNGSGKSTLLKMLAGVYTPDSGAIAVNGSLTPFIELGVGFNPELTGRENVFLNGALLGYSRKEMEAMYEEIVEFAELERFMDQTLKNYSSGMQVRLAFSIAIKAESDILLLDEVLAVGDEAFQKKCFDYFEELKKKKKTVVLVTHDMGSVKRFCTRAMLISDGDIIAVGDPDDIGEMYTKLNNPQEQTIDYQETEEDKSNKITVKYNSVYSIGDEMKVDISWHRSDISALGVVVYKASGERIFATNSTQDRFQVEGKSSVYKVKLDVAQGSYFLKVRTYTDDSKTSVGLIEQTPLFTVDTGNMESIDGLVPLNHEWSSR